MDRKFSREEIEITPKMLEAGYEELRSHDFIASPSEVVWKEAIRAVYRAMYAASNESP